MTGKYDFTTPQRLSVRIVALINWWRYQAHAGDEGSITIMADQLERALNGPVVDCDRCDERHPINGACSA